MGGRHFYGKPDAYSQGIDSLSPTDQIKRDIIQLARESTAHLAKSWDNNAEKYAFTVKVRIMSIRLQNFTPLPIRIWLRDRWRDEKSEVSAIEKSTMSEENKKLTILRKKYENANDIFDTYLMVLHNSPLVEMKSEGEISLLDNDILSKKIRKRRTEDTGVEITKIREPLGEEVEQVDADELDVDDDERVSE
jgi:Fe2+ transport system protein B